MIALFNSFIKKSLYDVGSSFFCSTTHVRVKVWQPSYCLSGPPILSGNRGNKTLTAWTKGGKDAINTVCYRVLRTLSLFFVCLWKYRILELERNKNLKIPQDTIDQPAPEVTFKFKEEENSTAQKVWKCELYGCTLMILYSLKSARQRKVYGRKKPGFSSN